MSMRRQRTPACQQLAHNTPVQAFHRPSLAHDTPIMLDPILWVGYRQANHSFLIPGRRMTVWTFTGSMDKGPPTISGLARGQRMRSGNWPSPCRGRSSQAFSSPGDGPASSFRHGLDPGARRRARGRTNLAPRPGRSRVLARHRQHAVQKDSHDHAHAGLRQGPRPAADAGRSRQACRSHPRTPDGRTSRA